MGDKKIVTPAILLAEDASCALASAVGGGGKGILSNSEYLALLIEDATAN